jgi:hypothetical protein
MALFLSFCATTSDSLAPAHLQAAASARIQRQYNIHSAANSGNALLVLDHIVVDPATRTVHAKDEYLYVVCLCLFLQITLRIPLQWFHLISFCTPSGNTALHLSSERGHREVCELLISSGAQVDARNWRYFVDHRLFFYLLDESQYNGSI